MEIIFDISIVKTVVAALLVFLALHISAQTLPPGFATVKVGGTGTTINAPSVMAFAPDGRIFVAEQTGSLRVFKDNVLLSTPFITFTVNSSGERGLIGVALDPEFSVNQFIYLYHTMPSPGTGVAPHNRISRFTANGDVSLPGSRKTILDLDPLSTATNHNGGALAFGSDGKLYVAVGDNALGSNAQNLDTYHGKLLRINKEDGSAPNDNPFYSDTGSEQRKRIWALGLRNPFTFSIQPGTGKIFVNDVGQNSVEEINDATQGGKNFGWPTAEGVSTNPSFTNPVFSYKHSGSAPTGCAITGGSFFNPLFTTYPASYVGKYFFLDYCSNWIYALDISGTATATLFASSIKASPVSLHTGLDGNLYYLSRSAKALFKITSTNSTAPVIAEQPLPINVPEGDDAVFTVTATGTAPLTYQWQKNNIPIEGATESSLIIPTTQLSDGGTYRVTITNIAGAIVSDDVLLIVSPNVKPTAIIDLPLVNTTYAAGTSVIFSGHGTDPEDGDLLPSALSWTINFHHNEHIHDQPPVVGVADGSFDIPNQGETAPNVWYRIHLAATDSKGVTGVDSVDIVPRLWQLTVNSEPTGLQMSIDGQLFFTPTSVESVEGLQREIGVVADQELGENQYTFNHWTHGGAATQIITTPTDDTAYTAVFDLVLGVTDETSAKLFPVPAHDWLNIKLEEPVEIFFTDMLGKKWNLPSHTEQDKITFDVRFVPSGVYCVGVTKDNRTTYYKVIIQR